MKRKFTFQLDIDDDEVGDSGIIEIDQQILDEGLSAEFRESFYTFADEEAVAAHIAWALVVRDYRPEEIEGWLMTKEMVKIIEHPQGWNDYGCTAKAIE